MDENPYRRPDPAEASVPQQMKRSTKAFTLLLVLAIVGIGICLLLPVVRTARPAGHRSMCNNNFRQIAIAMLNYEAEHRALPPAYTVAANGKPLHSWRTLILPYLEQRELYESIDLTKPWDDPVNEKARETSLELYQCPSVSALASNTTTYLAVVTPTSSMRPGQSQTLAEITDGSSSALMLIEVDPDHAVPWMSPVDADEQVVLGIGPDSKLAHPGGMHAAFVDGHVAFLQDDLPADQRRALISSADNDEVSAEVDN